MVKLVRNHHKCLTKVFQGFLVACWASTSALGETTSIDEGLIFLSHLTRGSALEGAGSHGSFGTHLGGGTSAHLLPEKRELLSSLFGDKNTQESMSTPRLWLTKGLPLPIDLGMALAYAEGAFGASAYGQWTVFEGFRRPALALRVAEGRLYGAKNVSLESTTSEAILSFGFLKLLTAYTNFGMAHHRGEVMQPLELALTGDTPGETKKSWQEIVRRAGLQIGSPLMSLTGETTIYPGNLRDYAAKISILL